MPASPLDPSVPGLFGQRNPQPASRNAAAVRTGTSTVALSTPMSPSAAQAAAATRATAAEALFLPTGTGPSATQPVVPGGSPSTLPTTLGPTGFNPLTGVRFFPGNPAANFLAAVPNGTSLVIQVSPSLLAAQVGTTSLPTEEGLQAPWLLQQHNLPSLLSGGGGSNAMLGPNTQDNPRANPRPAVPPPNGEQEEPGPNLDNGDDGVDATMPPAQPGQPDRPGAAAAPVKDGEDRHVLLIEPVAAEKLPGWEVVQETPAETVQPVEQAPAQAPASPAPFWLRFVSAVSFAAGAVGAVWVPKFGAAGMSREELLGLRRGPRRGQPL